MSAKFEELFSFLALDLPQSHHQLNLFIREKNAQILEKLELVFGNVYSSEALLQKFYMENQEPNQTVAEDGMKLESILQSAIEKGHISPDS